MFTLKNLFDEQRNIFKRFRDITVIDTSTKEVLLSVQFDAQNNLEFHINKKYNLIDVLTKYRVDVLTIQFDKLLIIDTTKRS